MLITKIQRFSTHDGPGIRTAVFFKGCPLSCFWCHNPENNSFTEDLSFDDKICVKCGACEAVCENSCHVVNENGHTFNRKDCTMCGACVNICPACALELIGKEMTPQEIVDEVLSDKAFYGSNGGITLTGGEPLAHKEAIDLLKLCEEKGISCCFETSGAGAPGVSRTAASMCDTFYVDIKDGNAERLFENTGADIDQIDSNIKAMDQCAKGTFVIRAILLKGVNMDSDNYDHIAKVFSELKHCSGVELVPYHALYGNKYTRIGLKDESSKDYIPDEAGLKAAEEYLRSKGVTVI